MKNLVGFRLRASGFGFLASVLLGVVSLGAQTPAIPPQPLSAFVEPGVLPKAWMSGGPKCMEQPSFQVHEYNPNFFILRQSGCIHYEKPFLFLIFGRERALLEDTGAGQIDTASVVSGLVAQWAKRNHRTGPVPLVVRSSVSSWITTTRRSRVSVTSSSTMSHPAAMAPLKAARVFSGKRAG